MPITLLVALRLTETNNLDIAQAREVMNQVRAQYVRARLMILPNLNIGSNYVDHEGNIQRTEGNIIKTNRDSLFVGGGPTLSLGVADAIFAPLVAQQVKVAAAAGAQRVHNDTLLTVADAYLAMLRARRRLARVEATLEFLVSDKPSATRSGSKGLLPVVEAIYKAGLNEALRAEVERVRVEIQRREEERLAAVQELRVAAAELARLVRLDPQVPLWPLEDFRCPISFRGPWYNQPREELVRVALESRPELAENQALVQAAVERVKNARFRPLLPNLVINYSWGDFGGGPDPRPAVIVNGKTVVPAGLQSSGRILHMNTRSDFDVTLVWRLQNMGFGNLAEIKELETVLRGTSLRQLQMQDRVVTQVVQTQEQLVGWQQRMHTARAALFDAEGKSTGPVFQALRLNFDRVRQAGGRPLETLDAIRGLNDLLETYGQAVTDSERARFRLLIALGLPPEQIFQALDCGQPLPDGAVP